MTKGAAVLPLSLYAACFSALALLSTAAPMLEVGRNDPVVVVFSPLAQDGPALRAIANAGASVVAVGKTGWIGMSGPLTQGQRQSLTDAGALLFLNGARSAWLCGPQTENWS